MTDLVFYSNPDYSKAKSITNSLLVAEFFGKEHSKVLRDIRELDCSKEFNEANFGLVEYIDKKGEKRPYYLITKDGWMFLCMGYRGQKASKIKEEFIHQFNKMEQELLRRQETRQIGATIRKDFTDTIKIFNSGEDNAFVKWSYKLFTDFVYKLSFHKTCKQLKIERTCEII